MPEFNFDLEYFHSYVYHSQKYRTKLEIALDNGLWEYSTVLVWKNIVLFIYEKLFQIKVLGNNLPKAFDDQLSTNNITVHNCLDFCCLKDDNIYTNLNKIWENVDSNYKQMFKGLLDDRNSLSHVNRYEEVFNEQWFNVYCEKSLLLLEYLQDLNNIQLSQKIYKFIEDDKPIQYFSEQDINYLLLQESVDNSKIINHLLDYFEILNYSDSLKARIKDEAINCYLDSTNFILALINGKRLMKLANDFTDEDVRVILEGIFERQGANNQITESGEMESVILDLFDKTINLEGIQDDWKIFIDKLIEVNQDKYDEIKEKFVEIYGEEDVEEHNPLED